MRPTRADAFRLAVREHELTIEFGRSGAAGAVRLSDAVTLSPETAERLLHGLREALQRRAPVAVPAEGAADSLAGPAGLGATPVNLPADPAAVAAERLLTLLRALGAPYAYERSFRLAPGSLQANRFLASLNLADLGDAGFERALAVAQAMGMSAAAQQAARAAAQAESDALHCLHFGFEAGEGGILCKLYLERQVSAAEIAAARAAGRAALLHLAFKWNVDSGAHVVTRYDWYPGLGADGIATRLRALYGQTAHAESLQIALEALQMAADRVEADTLQYLEVREPENGRSSFDLNLYDAGLQVRDLLPLLLRMRDLQGVRPGQFQALVDQIRNRALGHLAGGVHRDGRDFFNVYYGVTGFPQFASRLA
jgi:tryptophan halogenase